MLSSNWIVYNDILIKYNLCPHTYSKVSYYSKNSINWCMYRKQFLHTFPPSLCITSHPNESWTSPNVSSIQSKDPDYNTIELSFHLSPNSNSAGECINSAGGWIRARPRLQDFYQTDVWALVLFLSAQDHTRNFTITCRMSFETPDIHFHIVHSRNFLTDSQIFDDWNDTGQSIGRH